jgi:hypothetical protein
MKEATKDMAIVVALVAVIGATVYFSFIPAKVEHTPTTVEVFALTPVELAQLEKQVAEKDDGEAAWRISQYQEFSRQDSKQSEHWRKKAAELGCEAAMRSGPGS